MASSRAGGRATHSGTDYQSRVAAWFAVQVLAGESTPAILGLPTHHTLSAIRCETAEEVDDVLVETSANGFLLIQAKRRLSMSGRPHSLLASAVAQCVRQFLRCREGSPVHGRIRRRLEAGRDRLTIVTHPSSTAPVRESLPIVLTRLAHLRLGKPLEDAAANAGEREVLSKLLELMRQAWVDERGEAPESQDIVELAGLLRILVLNPETDGRDEQDAERILRSEVLRRPADSAAAWTGLASLCARLSALGDGRDRMGLQNELLRLGLGLKTVISYRDDVERLRQLTQQSVDLLDEHSKLSVCGDEVRINRAATDELLAGGPSGPLVIVGEPGAGKSGVVRGLADALQRSGKDVLLLTADRVAATSLPGLRLELGLDHDLVDVLKNWQGDGEAYVIVDALDAIRDAAVARALRDVMKLANSQAQRWRIVASIRKFDLRYSPLTQEFFGGNPHSEHSRFQDDEFLDLRPLNVARLTDDELAQIESQSLALWQFLDQAPAQLRGLLRVPFNLRLLANLLAIGAARGELNRVRTQLDLLDLYWQHRVIGEDSGGDERENALRALCNAMVQNRALRASRSVVPSGTHIHELLRSGILVEWRSPTASSPDRDVVAFSHHMLFDYAVSRLLFRHPSDAMVMALRRDQDLLIVVRPSIMLQLQHVWRSDSTRGAFWRLAEELASDDQLPELAKTMAPAAAVDLVETPEDLQPLGTLIEGAEG